MSPTLLCSVLFLAWAFSPSAAQTSCRGRCGGDYNRGHTCQCDYSCLSYGECCKDYESQCTTRQSCRGRCGENFKRGRLCSCDPDCVQYKQCCPDYKQHCDEEEIEETEELNGAAGVSAPASSCINVNANKPKDESLTEATDTPLSFSEGHDSDLDGATEEFSNYEGAEADPAQGSTSGYDPTPADFPEEPTAIATEETTTVGPETDAPPSGNDLTPADGTSTPDEPTDFIDDTNDNVIEQLPDYDNMIAEVVTPSTTTAALTEEPQTVEQVNPTEASSTTTPSSTSTESPGETSTAPTTAATSEATTSDPNVPQSSVATTTHTTSPSDATQPAEPTDGPPTTTAGPTVSKPVEPTDGPLSMTTESTDPKPVEPTDGLQTSTTEPTNPEPAEPTDGPLIMTQDPTNPKPAEPTDGPSIMTQDPTNPKPAEPTDGPSIMTQDPTNPKPAEPSDRPLTMTPEPTKPTPAEPTSQPQAKPEPHKPHPTTPAKPDAKPQNADDTREYQGDDSNDPNLCSGRPVSGVTTLRNGTIVVFRGHYFWFLDSNRVPGPPRGITQVWGVPSPIDTVFTRCNCQGKTYIFKGPRYWRFENDVLDPGYPKVIQTGFDGLRGHITAALSVPQHRNRRESVYFFKRGGHVQKYSYQFGTSPTCGRKPQIAISVVRNRVARQAVSLLGPTINIRKSWKGFPTTITAAVSVPSRREPDGYKYYVFSRSKSYSVRMDGQRPAIAAPSANASPQSNAVFNCPRKV